MRTRSVDDLQWEVEEVQVTLPREDWIAIVSHLEILQGHHARPIDAWQAEIVSKRILRQVVTIGDEVS